MLKMLTKPKPRRKPQHIGPQDDGRRMSLDDFDGAIGQEGYIYELNQGVVEVSGIPHPDHGKQVRAINKQLEAFDDRHPGLISYIGTGSEAKVLIGPAESERHPDLSIYFDPTPDVKNVWSVWVPAIVIEVVSDQSAKRDYEQKPEEYLAFGVREYWIVDSIKKQMRVMSRSRGEWLTANYKATQKFKTPLLPGFLLDLKKVFAAAR